MRRGRSNSDFGTNRTISLTCSPALDRWDALLRRCEDYASELNGGFPPGPGQTRPARPARIARAGRWQPRYDRIFAEISEGCDGGHVGTRTRVNGFADRRVTTPPRGPNEGGAI